VGFALLESFLSNEQYISCKVILQLCIVLQFIINSGQGMDMVIKELIQQAGGCK